jgi:hypothetical protein
MFRVDIRTLQRKGRLAAGHNFGWQWSRDGEQFASIGVQTFHDAVELSYTRTPHEREPYNVYVMEFEGEKIKHMTKIWHAGLAMKQLGWV